MNNEDDRELRITASFKVPLMQLWDAWTKPEHLIHWWGPKGFTSTIHKMDFSEGGEWKLSLHAPDGTNYPNRSIFREIIPLRKIVFEHFNPHFITTVLFVPDDDTTSVSWSLLFDSEEMRETIAKAHKAEEGQKQNIEKLENYLSGNL